MNSFRISFEEKIKLVVDCAKDKGIPIRIGVNGGSLEKHILEKYGRKGVEALSSATPRRTGLTASSWDYAIKNKNGQYELSWYNTNIQNGLPIAIILNYGHGTSNGSYVVGRNYIEPAIAPILDEIAEEVWKEVSNI